MPALTPVHSKLLAEVPNLLHGFTSKQMPKPERQKLDDQTATAVQVHKDGILWVDKFEKKSREADAIATFSKNLPVGVYSADCVPTLLAAVSEKTNTVYAVAAVHGGWRSTALGLAGKTLRELARKTTPHTRFLAAIGPCISSERFEVHDDVLKAFPGIELRGLARRVKDEDGRAKYLIDLPGETARQLREAANIDNLRLDVDTLGLCTVELTESFPSHRRRDREPMAGILSFLSFD
jgi:YfiH family protein